MKCKIKGFFLFFLVVLFFVFESFAQNESVGKKFAGSYYIGHSFGGSVLKLEADGSYSTGSGSDDGTEVSESGTYALANGVIHFTIKRNVLKERESEKEIDLLDPKQIEELDGKGAAGKIKREYDLTPIEWSERIYLIPEVDLKDFANAVNLGLEPRPKLSAEPYFGSFYLREGDETRKAIGTPKLPAEWQSFLLSKPINAKIISIKIEGKKKIATINKGNRDNLKVGMKLVGRGQEPSPWADEGVILSVTEKTATVMVEDLKVGGILYSKYSPTGYKKFMWEHNL